MKTTYEHVLFATDLTDDAVPAGRKAVAVALALGARFSLLHVLRAQDQAVGGEAGSMSTESVQWVNRHQQALGDLAHELGVDHAEHWVETAQAVPAAIEHAAREHGVDLIVMANHAKTGGILGRFQTTITEDLLHRTQCDLLAVRAVSER